MASAEAFAFLVAPMWTMLSIVTEGSGNSIRVRGHGLAYAAVVFVVVVVAFGCRCSGGGAGRSWTDRSWPTTNRRWWLRGCFVMQEGGGVSCERLCSRNELRCGLQASGVGFVSCVSVFIWDYMSLSLCVCVGVFSIRLVPLVCRRRQSLVRSRPRLRSFRCCLVWLFLC